MRAILRTLPFSFLFFESVCNDKKSSSLYLVKYGFKGILPISSSFTKSLQKESKFSECSNFVNLQTLHVHASKCGCLNLSNL